MANVYFNKKQLEALNELCSTWFSHLEAASGESVAETSEFNATVEGLQEKAVMALRKEAAKEVIAEALEIARRR